EFIDKAVPNALQVQELNRLVYFLAVFRVQVALRIWKSSEGYQLLNCQFQIEVIRLFQDGKLLSKRAAFIRSDIFSIQQYRTFLLVDQATDDGEQSAFSGAVGTNQRGDFPLGYRHGKLVRSEGYQLLNCQFQIEVIRLFQDGKLLSKRAAFIRSDIFSIQQYRTFLLVDQATDDGEQSAFSGAVGTNQRGDFPLGYRHGKLV